MKKICILPLAFLCITLVTLAQSEEKIETLKKDCKAAKEAFLKQDKELSRFFNTAVAYVIFPNVGKGGLGVGGAAGNGILYEKGKPVGSAKLTQVTIGFQAGGQAYREIIFFETLDEVEKFKANKVQLSAQASAVAAASGASANARYNEGVAIFTLAKKGLMYEASVGGQKFKFNEF